jgi:hypothetical protein
MAMQLLSDQELMEIDAGKAGASVEVVIEEVKDGKRKEFRVRWWWETDPKPPIRIPSRC